MKNLLTRISICVPIYEHDVRPLAEALLSQDIPASNREIIFFDDGSSAECRKLNSWLADEPEVIYKELGNNVGRAAIRNRLAAAATGDSILFLDDDSIIDNPGFLKAYLDAQNGHTVICGGRKYTKKLEDKKYALHWKYGRKMESKSAEDRNQHPYEAFHSNNFLIPKSLWKEISFDENLTQYGHEDTLFGYELSRLEYPIKHIDNEVIHGQLETNEEFLEKTKHALHNLHALYHRGNGDFNESVTLLRTFDQLDRVKNVSAFLERLYLSRGKSWERRLVKTKNPSLKLFNLYRLGYLCHLMRTSPEFSSK